MVSPVVAQAILGQQAPDVFGSFEQGLASGQRFQEDLRQKKIRNLSGLALSGDQEALDELEGVDGTVAFEVKNALGARDDAALNGFIKDARIGEKLLASGNIQGFLNFSDQRIDALTRLGVDSTQTQRIRNMVAQGQIPTALSELTSFTSAIDGAKRLSQVQSSDILPDGAVIQVMRDGTRKVFNPQGQEVSGSDAAKVIRQSRDFGAEVSASAAEKRATAKGLAKQRQDIKTTITENAQAASRSINKFKRIRQAIEDVGTGKISQAKRIFGSFIPGVDASNEQALNSAINDLVFEELSRFKGALSEGERAFAAETTANLGFTTEANKIILDRLIRRAEDAIKESKDFSRFTKRGGNPEDFIPSVTDELSTKSSDLLPSTQQSQESEIKFLGFE